MHCSKIEGDILNSCVDCNHGAKSTLLGNFSSRSLFFLPLFFSPLDNLGFLRVGVTVLLLNKDLSWGLVGTKWGKMKRKEKRWDVPACVHLEATCARPVFAAFSSHETKMLFYSPQVLLDSAWTNHAKKFKAKWTNKVLLQKGIHSLTLPHWPKQGNNQLH